MSRINVHRSTGRISPDKSKGQHFLVDDEVVADLVAGGQVAAGDRVIEIGPGPGAVTSALLATGAHVLAAELDRRFAPGLAKLQRRYPATLQVAWGDALTLGPASLAAKLGPGPYKIVSSLPYNISSRFFRTFLWSDPLPVKISVLVQAEVAERACAAPGKMSLLSLAVQLRGQPSIARYVERTSFEPQPEVRSAILCIRVYSGSSGDMASLWRLARVGFASRRKQLKNNLAGGLGVTVAQASDWLEQAGLSVQARAQDLSVEDWISLAQQAGE